MQAAGVAKGEPVGLPSNCRRAHSESVKRAGGIPQFVDLLPDLRVDPTSPGLDGVRLLWSTPVAGMPALDAPGYTLLVDYGGALPAPMNTDRHDPAAATIWSLHLADDDDTIDDGALIAFQDASLYQATAELVAPDDLPDLGRALAQCERLAGPDGLARRQLNVLAAARLGMEAGAGLPMMPAIGQNALPLGLAVQIPEEADAATFISYVRNENIPIDWLPEIQPMFYVTYQVTRDKPRTFSTATNIARWIVSPLGPDFDDDQVIHSVLGILKAAEYTGVRWYTNPERAGWYGDLMVEWYGSSHDAYRPAFLEQSDAALAQADD